MSVKILADSLNVATGDRKVSFLLERFPYTLIQEPATHRLLRWSGNCVTGDLNPFGEFTSRSSASSRAIPIQKIINRILEDPFIPTWTAHKKGMQGDFDSLDSGQIQIAQDCWRKSMYNAIEQATRLDETGIHKQHANDLLKPFMYIPILVSGTQWDNFFNLRCDKNTVRPEFYDQAIEMREAYNNSKPKELRPGEWHMVFCDDLYDPQPYKSLIPMTDALKVGTARSARLSYASHDGEISLERDFKLHDDLLKFFHMNPFEHSSVALESKNPNYPEYGTMYKGFEVNTRNLRGFYSYRAHIEDNIEVL